MKLKFIQEQKRNIIGGATVKIAEFSTKDELINYIESNDK